MEKYYFYRKTIQPDEYDFYHYGKGIAGYKEPQPMDLLLHGTLQELDKFLNNHKPATMKEKRTW